ncbi:MULTISPECIES: lysine-sensitive aspartokinase 3 [Arsenophonus]|uniref:lysine-sensitive aspartokinase 3 n=1 Tax=Arsenophonus TaxID=637 RepID=UPI0015D79D77|nr:MULTISPECIES: lysine-sensitive aspartokinase 3 [Arsenophonus]UBX28927.1 lysine-sensitive aspartokinase 3 [Arsenophonus apicola]
MHPVYTVCANKKFIIAKFGGTSVANFDAMCKSADIVITNKNVRIVVLSASSGITNLLLNLTQAYNDNRRKALLKQISQLQYTIMNRLDNSADIQPTIDHLLERLTTLSEVTARQPLTALEIDEIVSYGELMSSYLFVEILRQAGVNATWFDVRNIMKTNDKFGKAEPNQQQLKQLADKYLQPKLQESLIVTQGFIGQDAAGRTTTLGRGGSDYTAALIAEALSFTQVDIWTDVAGIYTTDPRIVASAKSISAITFNEAAEMATFGAKILHPATLLPAIRAGIPVFVGSSQMPEEGGTLICTSTEKLPQFRALTLRRKQTLLTLHSLKMLHARGFLAEVFTLLSQHHISVDLITTSEVSIALTLDTTGSTSTNGNLLTETLITELAKLCRVDVEEGLALVAIIGNNLSQINGLGSQIFSALATYNIRMICYGASSHNICLLVADKEAETIIQILHKNLFE